MLLAPNQADTHFNLSLGYERTGRLEEVLQEIEASLQLIRAVLTPETHERLSARKWALMKTHAGSGRSLATSIRTTRQHVKIWRF